MYLTSYHQKNIEDIQRIPLFHDLTFNNLKWIIFPFYDDDRNIFI